jgi:hypothetical protein
MSRMEMRRVLSKAARRSTSAVVIHYDKPHKLNVASKAFVLSDSRKQNLPNNANSDVRITKGTGNPPVLVYNIERAK